MYSFGYVVILFCQSDVGNCLFVYEVIGLSQSIMIDGLDYFICCSGSMFIIVFLKWMN